MTLPMHVIAFDEDVQAPPQDGARARRDHPGRASYHLMMGMGHSSWFGHAHDEINPYILDLIGRH